MATRTLSEARNATRGNDGHLVTWSGLLNGDDGSAFENWGANDRTLQVTGTFGTGGTIIGEGSNDGTNWAQLHDPQGNNISFTAAGLKAILETTRYIRARVTAGDGTTSLAATLLAVRSRDI